MLLLVLLLPLQLLLIHGTASIICSGTLPMCLSHHLPHQLLQLLGPQPTLPTGALPITSKREKPHQTLLLLWVVLMVAVVLV
jgi:hypothetical protein